MKKRLVALGLLLALLAGLCACGEKNTAVTPPPSVEPTATATPTVTPTATPRKPKNALEAYQRELRKMLEEHVKLAEEYHYDLNMAGQPEFAVCDVNMDGDPELVTRDEMIFMAGQHTAVCGYDPETGEVIEQGGGTASCRFYANGTMQDDISHNQGWSGRFWPFTALRYDKTEKEYKEIAFVEAWDRELMEEAWAEIEDASEKPQYPEEVDKEGAGFVYYIYQSEGDGIPWGTDVTPVSQSEYNAWYDGIFGGAKEIEVNYQPLMRENIKSSCAQAAYEAFLAGDMSLLEPVEPGWAEHMVSWWDFFCSKGEMEYTCLDLDGDGMDELLLQWFNDPQIYNGVFHYEDGTLQCWQHDEVEMNCRDYPLRNGTMVRQYRESYILFRYHSDGSEEELTSLAAEPLYPDLYTYCYQVDGEDADKTEFERQLKYLVTDQLLERDAWSQALPQQETKK